MDHFNGGKTVLDMHKYREQDMLKRAENERTAKALRKKLSRRLRNIVRKNINPAN